MTILEWERQALDGPFVKKLRREIRMRRREQGRNGHGFIADDLKTVWSSGDSHVIFTHGGDRSWQFWWRHPEKGWFLQSWHRLLSEAKQEADRPRVEKAPAPTPLGLYVCAEWKEPYSGRPIIIHCSSQYTAKELVDVFRSLGCHADTKTVV